MSQIWWSTTGVMLVIAPHLRRACHLYPSKSDPPKIFLHPLGIHHLISCGIEIGSIGNKRIVCKWKTFD